MEKKNMEKQTQGVDTQHMMSHQRHSLGVAKALYKGLTYSSIVNYDKRNREEDAANLKQGGKSYFDSLMKSLDIEVNGKLSEILTICASDTLPGFETVSSPLYEYGYIKEHNAMHASMSATSFKDIYFSKAPSRLRNPSEIIKHTEIYDNITSIGKVDQQHIHTLSHRIDDFSTAHQQLTLSIAEDTSIIDAMGERIEIYKTLVSMMDKNDLHVHDIIRSHHHNNRSTVANILLKIEEIITHLYALIDYAHTQGFISFSPGITFDNTLIKALSTQAHEKRQS